MAGWIRVPADVADRHGRALHSRGRPRPAGRFVRPRAPRGPETPSRTATGLDAHRATRHAADRPGGCGRPGLTGRTQPHGLRHGNTVAPRIFPGIADVPPAARTAGTASAAFRPGPGGAGRGV